MSSSCNQNKTLTCTEIFLRSWPFWTFKHSLQNRTYQITVEHGSFDVSNPHEACVLLSRFGFRLSCLESLLRSVLKVYAKLDQNCFKKLSVFSSKGKTTGWIVEIVGCLSLSWQWGFETIFWIGYVTTWHILVKLWFQLVKWVFCWQFFENLFQLF